MVLTMDDTKTNASDDDEYDENYEEESKESLIVKLRKKNAKLAEKDLIIEDLRAVLKREKKINEFRKG